MSSRSRARSRSKASGPEGWATPSVSTTSPASRHEKSASSPPPGSSIPALTRGRGRPAVAQIARKRRSSSLRAAGSDGRTNSIARRSRRIPRCPLHLPSRSWIALRSKISRRSARSQTSATRCGCMTAARSSSVRPTDVHGTPSTVVRSRGRSRDRCRTAIARRALPHRPGLVTSGPRSCSINPRAAAAECPHSAAPGPQARTAAIHRPLRESGACPVAYTASWIGTRRAQATRSRTALSPSPMSRSCASETTPC
jgi:hypothetical protein